MSHSASPLMCGCPGQPHTRLLVSTHRGLAGVRSSSISGALYVGSISWLLCKPHCTQPCTWALSGSQQGQHHPADAATAMSSAPSRTLLHPDTSPCSPALQPVLLAKELLYHSPIAKCFPKMGSCCKVSSSISSPSDFLWSWVSSPRTSPITLDLKHLPAKLIFSSPGGLADGSNLLVVRSPARTPGSPPVLLGGGFATHHDSVWRRPASTSWTVAGRSFLSKDKFAKIRISDYLQSQDKLVLAGETPAESEQRSCWSDW